MLYFGATKRIMHACQTRFPQRQQDDAEKYPSNTLEEIHVDRPGRGRRGCGGGGARRVPLG